MRRLLFLLLAIAACLCAQEFRSTLMGRVTDPSGLGVPNAKIVIVKTDTNTRSETVSGAEGNYTMPFLAPGPYEVTVEVAGFKKYMHSGIELGTNERIAEDIRLQVGSSTESITVTEESPLVSAMTASAGEVITTQEVANLPMNGNTPLALARNALGVIPKQKHLLNEVKPYDVSSAVDISLGGANSGSNEYLLDGVPNMSSAARAGAFSPSMDAVDEVKVELYQVDAAYGDTL
ncbi:MAG: carboxypeptidase-like regulatory domain-containing protein, partial [Bryobacteraceae bacterium]